MRAPSCDSSAPRPRGARRGGIRARSGRRVGGRRPVLSSTFANGAGGWTATSSCAPLCSVANTIDPGPGASGPGSATVIYTTLAGLLGGLASGTSTWTSPSFTWPGAAPDHATVSLARKAAIGGLLSAGGSASSPHPAGRPDGRSAHDGRGREHLHRRCVIRHAHGGARSVPLEGGALLPAPPHDEPLGRGAPERHPRLLRRRHA